ncbi:hypothetical protein COLO4_20912 [Corchorus olitorius]|uniref:Uncharacterized protein n=1 Tax=Corchorus olitorius TaxID=93759 RepID=A0A1R3IWA2_9ROSI|nr:hypothetical protein COLO4_20912 [Corchorus olitorius]
MSDVEKIQDLDDHKVYQYPPLHDQHYGLVGLMHISSTLTAMIITTTS